MKKRKDEPPQMLKVTPQRIQDMKIAIPQLEYKVVAQPILKTQFTGSVTVMPTVLIFYLYNIEFRVVATIIQETMEKGVCVLTIKQIAIRNQMDIHSVYTVLHNLRRMQLMYEERDGKLVKRGINFDAAQHLNDLTRNEDRGVYTRLRGKVKNKIIFNITKKDLEKCYDQYVLPPDHDIEEEEEYD